MPVVEVRLSWHVGIFQHDLRLVNRQDKRGVPGDLRPLQCFSQRQQERRRRRGAEGRRGKKRKLLLLFIVDLSRRSAPSSPVTLCCFYSPARLALSAKLIFVCKPWLQRAHRDVESLSGINFVSLRRQTKKKQKNNFIDNLIEAYVVLKSERIQTRGFI